MSEVPNVADDNLDMAMFITLARIYDCLILQLTLEHPVAAKGLLEMHKSGVLMGTVPSFDGTFVTDEINELEDDESQP